MSEPPSRDWAQLFDAHAAALLDFAGRLGLEPHQAEIATGRILVSHAVRCSPTDPVGVIRRSMLMAMLAEAERLEGKRAVSLRERLGSIGRVRPSRLANP